ncbi:N-acetylglucosamine-6-phosphate deacetylase [Psychromarinibacter sp. C21-152]|uniref:N-acetylglucosamine-6-phosphate deacetylase n=1 Tax=Psychromarinibacter sediminicola TaxID=3033385 RepID=A0AAE3NT53_9RHOB|nr:N-acetylglucosamine-6-phosphate deacetylase [Psychromarinibacter sediminicola]MDF0601586.1 N-acetylglucosamine-6-phosphate deacetylase [Psychromarinibacter sediminicola]
MSRHVHIARAVFDGTRLHEGHALLVEDGRVAGLTAEPPAGMPVTDHGDAILAPGFVDLQVNGGGGVMLDCSATPGTLARIAEAHARRGTTALLPTLITDTPDATRAVIDAVAQAIAAGTPGIAGLHLEGPHLSTAKKGAHRADLVRPMTDTDLARLREAAARLPALMVTVAPEAVPPDRIAALVEAGIIVSLGHSNAPYDSCIAAAAAGARCVTHLFNAMSPLDSRAPGLVGAALDCGTLAAGVIADGIHIHPATLGAALRAKRGPARLFLVTDAMAVAGTDRDCFALNGRRIARRDGQLMLEDGTLAGADLDMPRALAQVAALGVGPEQALAMATSIPAAVIAQGDRLGHLAPGRAADFVALTPDWQLGSVWRGADKIFQKILPRRDF